MSASVLLTETIFVNAASVGFGLLWGSFLNVVIYRLPRKRSVVRGRSQCPGCSSVIRWYDNIPVLSYLILRGRCRRCSYRIPVRYPTVELLSGVIGGAVVWYYGPGPEAAWIFVFLTALLVITFIDWSHRIIPDELSIGGTVFGWVGAVVCLDVTLVESLIGSAVGFGILFLIAIVYKLVRKVDGMGGGDIKLMAMIGAFLGWKMVFVVLFVASLFGAVYGVYLMRRGGGSKTAVAFGSFLAPSATIVLIAGARFLEFYLQFLKQP